MALSPSPSGGGDDPGQYRAMAEINVTPLVDVMLVLLIIFMVAAPLMMVGVPVQLPKTAAAKISQPKKPVIVSIDREGRVFLGEDLVEPDMVMGRLTEAAAVDKDTIVYVRGDKTIAYGRVMELMGRVSTAGFAKVSLIAEAPGGPPVPAPR